jgi:hypothetical protein
MDQDWKPILAIIVILGTVIIVLGVSLMISEAPTAVTKFSQIIHLHTPFDREWDGKLGDEFGKASALKCLQLVGREKFLEAVQKHSVNRVTTDEVVQKILRDPEIFIIISETANVPDYFVLKLSIFKLNWLVIRKITTYLKDSLIRFFNPKKRLKIMVN